MHVVYTIGHSTHPIELFLNLVSSHGIDCIVDVRSIAASRFNPQYNKKSLQESLNKKNILYLHFDKEFGARQTDSAVLTNHQVDFQKVRSSPHFLSGMSRLHEGVKKGYTIALMCAEAEPLQCHRFGMITPALSQAGFDVRHILKHNTIVSTHELEDQLLAKFKKKIPASDLYTNRTEKLQRAYRLLNDLIGYKVS